MSPSFLSRDQPGQQWWRPLTTSFRSHQSTSTPITYIHSFLSLNHSSEVQSRLFLVLFWFFLVPSRLHVVASRTVSSKRARTSLSLLGNLRHAGSWVVTNMAKTSALCSHQTPPVTPEEWRGGGSFHRNRCTSADLPPHVLILHNAQIIWVSGIADASKHKNTSWLFLFYCGGKHLLNYRCEPKRTLDLNPAGPRWIWEGQKRGRKSPMINIMWSGVCGRLFAADSC